MARTATRTTSIYTRVDPETKEQAELILNQLGIPMSNAIGMFLKQIVIQRGIPFELKIPSSLPLSIDSLTARQFNTEIQKGIEDIESGHTFDATIVESEMKRKFGL